VLQEPFSPHAGTSDRQALVPRPHDSLLPHPVVVPVYCLVSVPLQSKSKPPHPVRFVLKKEGCPG